MLAMSDLFTCRGVSASTIPRYFLPPPPHKNVLPHAAAWSVLFQLNFSMSTEDGASTKRQKANAMLGQLREGNGADDDEGGGTEGWEEVRVDMVTACSTVRAARLRHSLIPTGSVERYSRVPAARTERVPQSR